MSGQAGAFGFGVESTRPTRFGRPGLVEDVLDVGVCHAPSGPQVRGSLVAEWNVGGASKKASAKLYRDAGGYAYETAAGITLIDPENRSLQIPDVANPVLWEEHVWGIPAILCLLHRGDFPIHAAVVETPQGAILLAGPGRFGKTTLAVAFHEAGCRVLSEDVACCRVGEEPIVFPGPALLRVRPDVFGSTPPTHTTVVFRHAERVYLEVAPEARGTSAPVPIRAIALLRIGNGATEATRAAAHAAVPDLWALNFRLPGEAARAKSFRQLAQLADRVPIWNVARSLERRSLPETVDTILALARS